MIETIIPSLDLGDVILGTNKHFTVELRNTYPSAKVVTTQMSCGACTHFESGPDLIPPGREGIFTFRFHPLGTGEQLKSIFFFTDGNQEAQFYFRANVTASE